MVHKPTGSDAYLEWEVIEYFGLEWPAQAAHVDLDAKTAERIAAAGASLCVVDETGHAAPAQLVRGEGGAEVWYTADLKVHARKIYRLRRGPANSQRPLRLTAGADRVELCNDELGIRLAWVTGDGAEPYMDFDPPRPLDKMPGPIAEIRGPDGQWFGSAFWQSRALCKALRCQVLEQGPVLLRARQTYELADDGEIIFEYQLDAVTPAVQVLQRCTAALEGQAMWEFYEAERFEPTHALWRIGTTEAWRGPRGDCGRQVYAVRYPETPDEIFLIPFHGWEKNLVPLWSCSSERKDRGDLLVIGAIRPSRTRCVGGFQPYVVSASQAGVQRHLAFTSRLQEGQKLFFLGMLKRHDGAPETDAQQIEGMFRQLHYLGLDEYHHMTLDWEGIDDIRFPHLMLMPDEVDATRSALQNWTWLRDSFAVHVNDRHGGDASGRGAVGSDWAGAYLATGDVSYAEKAKAQIAAQLDEWIRLMTGPMYNADIGFTRPWRATCVAFDLVAGSAAFTTVERRAFLRKFAFIAEVASTADYWPAAEAGVVRGGKNFHPDYVTAKGACAALLSGHPRQREWMDYAVTEAARFLREIHFPSGCQEEPSTYQLFTLGAMMVMAAAVGNAGGGDLFAIEPMMKKAFEYLAAIQTPKDPRAGFCMLPTIGHVTSYGWSQSLQAYFAWAAKATAASDPAFSRRMMTAWKRAGAPAISLHDYAGGMIWWQPLCFIDRALPDAPDPMHHQSCLYEGLGAIFRKAHDDGTEGYLLVKMGPSRSHYDADEGSLIWYAYGRPVLADFGTQYFPNLDTFSWLHNRISFDGWNEVGTHFDIVASTLGEHVDYICGEMTVTRLWRTSDQPVRDPGFNARLLPGPRTIDPITWRRHVLYIGASEAVVILDELRGTQETDWNLQVFAEEPQVAGAAAYLRGQFGVDLDVHFALPAAPALSIGGFEHLGFDEPLSPTSAWWRGARWTAPEGASYGPLGERAISVRVRAVPNREPTMRRVYLALVLARRSEQTPALVSTLPGQEGFEWTNAQGRWRVHAQAEGRPWQISVEGQSLRWSQEIAPGN